MYANSKSPKRSLRSPTPAPRPQKRPSPSGSAPATPDISAADPADAQSSVMAHTGNSDYGDRERHVLDEDTGNQDHNYTTSPQTITDAEISRLNVEDYADEEMPDLSTDEPPSYSAAVTLESLPPYNEGEATTGDDHDVSPQDGVNLPDEENEEHFAEDREVEAVLQESYDNDSGTSAPVDFRNHAEDERQRIYENSFGDKVIALQDFQVSSLCDEYPELREEILDAYLEHVTVEVTIWANYDSVTKYFYTQPSRVHDCGKLQLSANQRAYLNSTEHLEFSKVRLLVGNPFRTLASADLNVRNGELVWVSGSMMKDIHTPHERLRVLMRDALHNIKADGITGDQVGLSLRDLDEIAKEFVREPMDETDLWKEFLN